MLMLLLNQYFYLLIIMVKCLAVILFHNDEDIVEYQIDYYRNNNHDIMVINHNSSDRTDEIIRNNIKKINWYIKLDDTIVFKNNKVHETISKIIRNEHTYLPGQIVYGHKIFITMLQQTYYWISLIESDEVLEGPNRSLTFYDHLQMLSNNKNIKGIQYLNFVFWCTDSDDLTIENPFLRVKHYGFYENCGKRFYTWRGDSVPITFFGHTPPLNSREKDIVLWNTKHFDCRSKEQYINKVIDRRNVTIGGQNSHYDKRLQNHLNNDEDIIMLRSTDLHYDDGSELIMDNIYDWSKNFY